MVTLVYRSTPTVRGILTDRFVLQVAEGIYQHVDVREEGKENVFSLGHTLWIGTEVRAAQSHCVSRWSLLNGRRFGKAVLVIVWS